MLNMKKAIAAVGALAMSAGLLAGCRVYFLDNNYGKLSGVYRQSLSDHPRANLLPHSELSVLFPEIFSLVRK